MRPTSWSCCPLITCRSSSVSLPHFSLTLPANCFQLPSTRSQFIACSLFLMNSPSVGQRTPQRPVALAISPLLHRNNSPHKGIDKPVPAKGIAAAGAFHPDDEGRNRGV